jgi:hypothetical protein
MKRSSVRLHLWLRLRQSLIYHRDWPKALRGYPDEYKGVLQRDINLSDFDYKRLGSAHRETALNPCLNRAIIGCIKSMYFLVCSAWGSGCESSLLMKAPGIIMERIFEDAGHGRL